MNKIYQRTRSFHFSFFLLLSAVFCNGVGAQTLSTIGGTNYNGAFAFPNGGTAAGAITFVVQNANATPRLLTKVDCYAAADQPDNIYSLWFTATSLSGPATIASPVWTLAATGVPITVEENGIVTVLDNINLALPANTQYRFALTTTAGIRYSAMNANNPQPSPNNFSAGGLTLRVGNSIVSGLPVGFGGGAPAPANANRYFTGSLFFTTCSSTAPASTPVITPDTVVCGEGNAVTLRLINGNLNGSGNWHWYSGSCGGTFVGTGTSITVNPLANTSYYARGEGGCAAAGSCGSTVVTVRTKPGTPTIAEVAPICQGDLATLTINPVTLGTTPIPDSFTISSGALSIAVPDNTGAGVSTSLTVPALAFGSQMTGVEVTLNMQHTYPGDMIFHLQAPNGNIANLYKYNGGTFTGDAGDLPNSGWFNAVTSSAGTVAYSSIAAPYQYNAGVLFAPDLLNGAVPGPGVQNPDGFVSNAVDMSELYSIPAGSWTLAMADGGPADLGTLTEWSLKIRYNRFEQIPAQPAVWTPGNTLFNDAAGTIPYDGTSPRMEVFAQPNSTTTYTATSLLNGCYSEPVTVNVTVNIPSVFTDTMLPANTTICEFGTAAFEVTAAGTNPSYQWQTDRGTGNFENITDNANYTGATTDSLTVKGAPFSWNGYKYHCVLTSTSPCTSVVTSNEAVLTVNPSPTVILSAEKTALIPGNVSTLSVSSNPAGAGYSWIRNNLPFDRASSSTFDATVDDQGIYKVMVTDINGCVDTSNALEISDSVILKLFIYPNPSQDGKFSVSYHSLKGNVLPRILTIYDAKGALVLKRTYSLAAPYQRMEVDFSGLSKGLYFVNLLDRSAKRIASGKVVVK